MSKRGVIDRSAAPDWVKRSGRRLTRTVGRYTASARMLPSFVLAGGQRCGTTSLHRALIEHPLVAGPVFHKGINYFDLNYHRGSAWYRGHFPIASRIRRRAATSGLDGEPQAMESSGYYLYHPLAVSRLATDLPGVKVLVMLRDPVERAYSAYKHEWARGFETETFERALELEPARVAGQAEKVANQSGYVSLSHRHHAYIERGRYAEQLRPLFDLVGREQVLVVESEAFFIAPESTYAGVLEFLGLPEWYPVSFERHNPRPGSGMDPELRIRLRAHYESSDEALAEILGREPVWRREAV